jgi:hypothetical protein
LGSARKSKSRSRSASARAVRSGNAYFGLSPNIFPNLRV